MPRLVLPQDPLALLAVVGALFLACTAIGLVVGFALERYTSKKIWSLPLAPGQLRHEARGNVQFLVVAIGIVSLTLHANVARLGEETALRFVLTFSALHLAFQAYYYALHRALHTHALVRFHRYHHESRVTTPLSGQSMSVVESLGWMVGYAGLPVALSFLVPISFNAWMLYLAFNVVGNIVGHANAEVVPPSRFLWWRASVAATFTYHALHHARWTGHYAFESSWADRLFGTEYKDWLGLHARVWSGVPLQSLKERGPEQANR